MTAPAMTWPQAMTLTQFGFKVARAHWTDRWLQMFEGQLRLCSRTEGAADEVGRPVLGGADIQSPDWLDVSDIYPDPPA